MSSSRGLMLALAAGTMAALASMSAKLAMSGEVLSHLCDTVMSSAGPSNDSSYCQSIVLLMRVTCFGLIFLFNALMWTVFTKSLQLCSSSVEATVTNTGSNFLVTALVSWVLFGERMSLKWWLGSCFILVGLLLIHRGSRQDEKITEKKET